MFHLSSIFRLVCLLVCLLAVGCTSLHTPQPSGPLPEVTVDGIQLRAGSRVLEVRGTNYVHTFDADLSTCPEIQFGADGNCLWDLTAIATDMERLQGLGINTVRIFLNYYAFGGAREVDPDYDLALPLSHLDDFIDIANEYGIYVMPVLLVKYPQDRFGPDHYEAALDLHVRPVVEYLSGRVGILAWDVFNEPDLGGPIDPRCWDWDNGDFPLCFELAQERSRFVVAIYNEVKRLDPERLVTVSMGFGKNYFKPDTADIHLADVVDLYSYHYYDDDPYDSGRYRAHWYYGEGFPDDLHRANAELHALGLDKPILITEIGFPTGPDATRTPEELPRDLQVALDVARDDSTAGIMLWPFQSDPDELIGDLFQ